MPTRTGYPPNPPLERIDFEEQADELLAILEPGDHLVAHSYGAVVSLLAAPKAASRSLTVLEPPAFGVARGNPAVDDLIAHNAAFNAICDVLEERLGAERVVLPGAGHSIPRAPGFNELLEEFVSRA